MSWLYSFSIFIYWVVIHLVSPWNHKAKKWIQGRKEIISHSSPSRPSIWFHCASLGEFEQARPVIDNIRQVYPNQRIVLSFFSPSGYEVRKNYLNADEVYYFPIDLPGKVKRFIEQVDPQLAIFVKYEFWFNCLQFLSSKQIPYIFISSVFRKNQYFFWPGMSWYKGLIKQSSMIFTQDEPSLDILKDHGFTNCTISGDTRVDQVISLKKTITIPLWLKDFKNEQKLWICGSLHKKDFKILSGSLETWIQKNKLVVVPHDIDFSFIQKIQISIPGSQILSEIKNETDLKGIQCIIVDKIGILKHLYPCADLVYIGGGFGQGIHNILEAAIFDKPIIIGPNFKGFYEAKWLHEKAAIQVVNRPEDLPNSIQTCLNPTFQDSTYKVFHEFFHNHANATDSVIKWITSSKVFSQSEDKT